MVAKRKPLILKLGYAFEKVVTNPESVCEEIKNCLKEEIAEKIILPRTIEQYCLDKWKKKTKPKQENEKFSFSEKSHHIKSATIAIDVNGKPVQEEMKSVNSSSSSPPLQEENESKGQELKTQDGIFDGHTFPYYQELLAVNRRIQEEKQKVEEGLAQALEIIEEQRETINELSQNAKSNNNNQSLTIGEVLDVEVPLLYRPLQEEMQSLYPHENKVWLTIRVNRSTANIAGVFLGRKSQGRTLGHSIVTSYV
jgi:hypothetical protein